jgi:hypothetical protein
MRDEEIFVGFVERIGTLIERFCGCAGLFGGTSKWNV